MFIRKNLVLSILLTVFISICGTAADVQAQSINDDLQPAKTTVNKSPRGNKSTKPAKKPAPVVYRKPAPPVSVRSTETSSEIIARYMNFQQSTTVTGADWDSVIRQSNAVLSGNANDKTAKAQLAIAQGQTAINSGDYSNAAE